MRKIIILFILMPLILLVTISCETPNIPNIEEPKCEIIDPISLSSEVKSNLKYFFYLTSIKKWYYSICRFPCGIINVYDETNYSDLEAVLNEIEETIQGPIKFHLTNNKNEAQILILEKISLPPLPSSIEISDPISYDIDPVTCQINKVEFEIKYFKRGEYLAKLLGSVVYFSNNFFPEYYQKIMNNPVIPETIREVIYYAVRLPIGFDVRFLN